MQVLFQGQDKPDLRLSASSAVITSPNGGKTSGYRVRCRKIDLMSFSDVSLRWVSLLCPSLQAICAVTQSSHAALGELKAWTGYRDPCQCLNIF